MAPFIKPKIVRRAKTVAKAGNAVVSAQDRYRSMANILEPRAVALDKKVTKFTERKLSERANAKLYQGRVQNSTANYLAARANTARTVFENLMLNGRPTWVTGKIIEGYWNWRSKRNAKMQGLSMEREALLTQAVASRKEGAKGIARSNSIRSRGLIEVRKLEAERAMAEMVLAVPGALKNVESNVKKINQREQDVLRALASVPAAERGRLSPERLQVMLRSIDQRIQRLSTTFNATKSKAIQEDIARRVARLQLLLKEMGDLAKNPNATTVIGKTPVRNTILLGQMISELNQLTR